MISLKRIVEQQGSEQYYDLGRDFANFRRTMDGTSEQIKQKFEQAIGSKLNGKRVQARASRGYKQYVKDYEFDISKITIDDYYDNFVIVAHDNTTPKPKEYFLKPGFKVTILGPATGQPSPQKGNKPGDQLPAAPTPIQPKQDPNAAQHQRMAQAPPGKTPSEMPLKEKTAEHYDAYSIEDISRDIKHWLPGLLKKPETALRDFIKSIGWSKVTSNNRSVAMFDIVVQENALKFKITKTSIQYILNNLNLKNKGNPSYELISMTTDKNGDEHKIRIKKTTMGTNI